jgi:hypothetical protein
VSCGNPGSWGRCKSSLIPGTLCSFEQLQANRTMGCR